jgi:hypothetical protein
MTIKNKDKKRRREITQIMENNYLLYIFPIPRKQTKIMECMCTPNFCYRLNKKSLIWENKKVRALFILTKNKDKKQRIKHTNITENNCILCIIFPL